MAELLKSGTTLVQDGAEIPDLEALSEADLDQPPTYVPNRNMMLLAIAVAYAEAHGKHWTAASDDHQHGRYMGPSHGTPRHTIQRMLIGPMAELPRAAGSAM